MGETTPPPENLPGSATQEREDGFPKVFNMTSNSFTRGGIHSGSDSPKSETTPEPSKPTKPEPEMTDEPPKRETKKDRRARLAKAAAEAQAAAEAKATTETNAAAKAKDAAEAEAKAASEAQAASEAKAAAEAKSASEVKAATVEAEAKKVIPPEAAAPFTPEVAPEDTPEKMETETTPEMADKDKPKATEPATAAMETAESGKPSVASKKVSKAIPVEIINISVPKMSRAVFSAVAEPEPIKPRVLVASVPEVINLTPVKPMQVETVAAVQPVVVEEICIDEPQLLVHDVQVEQVSSDEHAKATVETVSPAEVPSQPEASPAAEMTEAELYKKDIGKVAEKLVTKAKIKKVKTKKAVLRKSSTSEAATEDILTTTETVPAEASSGPKARKRPLEDATIDWTTEGQRKLLVRSCLTILIAVLLVTALAYFLIN